MADSDWTQHAAEILNDLDGQHAEKKRATILALVTARLEQRTEESVWSDPNVCSRKTYHTNWKKDQKFSAALADVTRFAQGWKNQKSARALRDAADRLAMLAGPAVTVLGRTLTSEDEAIALRAALAILDRAGIETAQKGEIVQVETNLDAWREETERRRLEIDAMLLEADAAEADAGEDMERIEE
jgi:hypothetical protein